MMGAVEGTDIVVSRWVGGLVDCVTLGVYGCGVDGLTGRSLCRDRCSTRCVSCWGMRWALSSWGWLLAAREHITDEALALVRELHAPECEYGYRVVCSGCPGDREDGQPDWPCGTADLVYGESERSVLLASFQPRIDAYRQEQADRRARVLREGSPSERLMLQVTDDLVRWALKPFPFITGFATGSVKGSVSIPISNEMVRGDDGSA